MSRGLDNGCINASRTGKMTTFSIEIGDGGTSIEDVCTFETHFKIGGLGSGI